MLQCNFVLLIIIIIPDLIQKAWRPKWPPGAVSQIGIRLVLIS